MCVEDYSFRHFSFVNHPAVALTVPEKVRYSFRHFSFVNHP